MEMTIYLGDEAREKREKPQGVKGATEFERMLQVARRDKDNRYVAWKVRREGYGRLWKKVKVASEWLRSFVSSDV